MKAVGFFLSVFVSMLLVFLIATGEVKRWFAGEAQQGTLVEIVPRVDPASPGKNMLEFDFFDVERAQLKFTIRAEFDQDELQLGAASLEEMTRLSLRNGNIIIPMSDEAAREMLQDAPAGGVGEASVAQERGGSGKLSLEFERATYSREGTGARGPLQVMLSRGKGSLEDGTRFVFEELALLEVQGQQGTYELRSTKPVKIEGPAFGVHSATGLQGKLTEGGQQDFQLLPPVRAVLRPGASLVAGRIPTEPRSGAEDDKRGSHQSIAVVADGPLSVQQRRGAEPGGVTSILLHFERNVVFYPVVADAGVESLPTPRVERFECQRMEVELANASGKPTLRRGLATWEGGRVKAYLQRGVGDEVYVLDGDRLEWRGSSLALPAGAVPQGEAVLDGNPVLRGKGVTVRAARAVFRPQEDRVVLETVHGRLDPTAAAGKAPRKRAAEPPGIELPEAEPAAPEGGDPGRAAASLPAPRSWELLADEAELVFTRETVPEAGGGPASRFSRIVARSRSDALVEVRGVGDPAAAEANVGQEAQVHALAKLLEYHETEKKVVLESVDDVKPRFSQGVNWLEARRIHLFQEENTAWFEDEVHARVEELEVVQRTLASPGAEQKVDKKPAGDSREREKTAQKPAATSTVDVDAAFLAVRFADAAKGHILRDVAARGNPGAPVRVTSLHGARLRASGQQMYWDHEKRVGFIAAGKDQEAVSEEHLARFETESGVLLSEKVTFEQSTWKAQLAKGARILVYDKGHTAADKAPALDIATGAAEVELFERFSDDGIERAGPLKPFGKLKALRAQRSAERPIEVRGEFFTAQSDECRWSSETRELRFTGTGMQQIALHHPDFHGPVRAREIVFEEAKSLCLLRGDVQGEIVQSPTSVRVAGAAQTPQIAKATLPESGPASPQPVSSGEPGTGDAGMTWQFRTSALELQVGEGQGPGAPALELKTLRARDKVDLRSSDGALQLRGDDLVYDHEAHKLRIFSPDGRPQTLIFDGQARVRAAAGGVASAGGETEGEAARAGVHKIASQIIWLVLYENPFSISQRGDPASWLLVQFEKDVIGNFHVPVPGSEKRSSGGIGKLVEDTWKMVAERLTLYVDPTTGVAGTTPNALQQVPWAEASGNVVFSSGALQATAERAVFEEAQARMTLLGNPARLSRSNETLLERREITLQRVGDSLGIRYRGGDARETKRAPFEPGSAEPAR